MYRRAQISHDQGVGLRWAGIQLGQKQGRHIKGMVGQFHNSDLASIVKTNELQFPSQKLILVKRVQPKVTRKRFRYFRLPISGGDKCIRHQLDRLGDACQ